VVGKKNIPRNKKRHHNKDGREKIFPLFIKLKFWIKTKEKRDY
jgi:hypothetical protein